MMNALHSISRRNALGLMAAVSFPPTAAVAVAAAHPGDVPNALRELLDGHAAALAADNAAWDALADIEDEPEMKNRSLPKVPIMKILRGRDDDGNDIWETRYAYSEEEIRKKVGEHMRAQLSLFPSGKSADVRARAQLTASYAEKADALVADLQRQQAERQRIEDEVGYTAARDSARATAASVKALEEQIIEYVPVTLSEAAMKAAWIVEAFHRDEPYVDTEEQLLEALAAIGRASA